VESLDGDAVAAQGLDVAVHRRTRAPQFAGERLARHAGVAGAHQGHDHGLATHGG